MTFRHETNKNSSTEKKANCGGAQNGQPAQISTIYDPRLRCSQPISPENLQQLNTSARVSVPNVNRINSTSINFYPKKAIIEKIKKFSYKLYLPKSVDPLSIEKNKRMRFIKLMVSLSILLACKIVLITAFLVFMFRTVQKPEIRNIVADGEFQILNRKFEYEMLDQESFAFQSFAFNLTVELNRLFRRSEVGEYFQRSEILEITSNVSVKCIVIFRSSEYVNVGRIGLAFLRGLRVQHGHTFLGLHTINVQSIGFQIRGEEGFWDEWTDWQGCEDPIDVVATRSRKCLTKDNFEVTNVDRCLLIPGKKGDFDVMPCKKYRLLQRQKEIDAFTKDILNNLNETDEVPLPSVTEEDSGHL